jgi:hypothetical protein
MRGRWDRQFGESTQQRMIKCSAFAYSVVQTHDERGLQAQSVLRRAMWDNRQQGRRKSDPGGPQA